MPNANNGSVVKSPACAGDSANADCSVSRTGATPVMGARRLVAIKRSPAISKAGRATAKAASRLLIHNSKNRQSVPQSIAWT